MTINETGVDTFSGCSAATPIASGIVTLALALDPGLDQDGVYEILRLGAEDQVGPPMAGTPGRDNLYGHGRLNADRTLAVIREVTRFCSAFPNSTGATGRIDLVGSNVVADDDFRLAGSSLPIAATSMFILGSDRADIEFPGGSNGRLCVGGSFGRIITSLQTSDSTGSIMHQIDLTSLPVAGGPAAMPGTRWHFQIWHRDTAGGPPTSNFSDAIDVAFL